MLYTFCYKMIRLKDNLVNYNQDLNDFVWINMININYYRQLSWCVLH